METENLVYLDDKGVEYKVTKVGTIGGRKVAWMKGRRGFVPFDKCFYLNKVSLENKEAA